MRAYLLHRQMLTRK